MLEVAQAQAIIQQTVRPLPASRLPLSPELLGRVLCRDIVAEADLPPFDKSLRDGFAVRAADCSGSSRTLRLTGTIAAGSPPGDAIGPGECMRIFTGAPIPAGADAVVMQEHAAIQPDGTVQIRDPAVQAGQWIYRRGTEMRRGDVILPAGAAINPAAIGVLASQGCVEVPVHAASRVAVVATGNELVDAAVLPAPGRIRNSNGPMLTALLARAGIRGDDLGIIPDDPSLTRQRLEQLLAAYDVVLIAGGVSVGAFDLVPAALAELGVAVHFRQVRMKPGKPLLFGTHGQKLVFGLPGNPVSSFVCFVLFVAPAIRLLMGRPAAWPQPLQLPIAEPFSVSNDRPAYHPARREYESGQWRVRPLPWSGAPDLRGLQPADALLVLPPGDVRYDTEQPVQVILLDDPPLSKVETPTLLP